METQMIHKIYIREIILDSNLKSFQSCLSSFAILNRTSYFLSYSPEKRTTARNIQDRGRFQPIVKYIEPEVFFLTNQNEDIWIEVEDRMEEGR